MSFLSMSLFSRIFHARLGICEDLFVVSDIWMELLEVNVVCVYVTYQVIMGRCQYHYYVLVLLVQYLADISYILCYGLGRDSVKGGTELVKYEYVGLVI